MRSMLTRLLMCHLCQHKDLVIHHARLNGNLIASFRACCKMRYSCFLGNPSLSTHECRKGHLPPLLLCGHLATVSFVI